MKDIFLCHSKKDRDKIIELHTKLEAFGYDSWLDENDILPGQKWKDVIKKAIKISRVVLRQLEINNPPILRRIIVCL